MKNTVVVLSLIFFICILCNRVCFSQDYYQVDPTARCEPYIGLTDSASNLCGEYLDYNTSVYVTDSFNQAAQTFEVKKFLNVLALVGSTKCKSSKNTFRSLCSMNIQECVLVSPNISNPEIKVAVPKRLCYEPCEETIERCEIPPMLFTCSSKKNNVSMDFPVSNSFYNFTLSGGLWNESISCYNSTIENDSMQEVCRKPLLLHESTDHEADYDKGYLFVSETSNCVVPCPVPIVTPEEWKSLYLLTDVLSILSMVGSFYLFFTFIIINKKRTRYDKMHSFFVLSVFGMSVSGSIVAFAGGPKILCPTPDRIAVFEDSICSAQGFLFQFFSIGAIIWWSYSAFDLYMTVRTINRPLKLMKFVIPIAFVIQTVFSVIPLATKRYRMIRGNMDCWLHGTKYQNGLFWIPLGICLTVGSVFICLVIYEIYKIVHANSKSGSIRLQLKPMLNIILIYVSFIYIFIFNFYMNGKEDVFYGQLDSFLDCLNNAADETQCVLKGPSIGSLGFFIFCIRIYGVYIFFLHGINQRAANIWRESIFFNNRFVATFRDSWSRSYRNDSHISNGGKDQTSSTRGETRSSYLDSDDSGNDEDRAPKSIQLSDRNQNP
ncbi:hypothetical protein CYY_002615 [Polysphondylium violaceum]|uniref:G-protein coupled receptors family 2 profile 2 domain-containing protein n=1 Tax=Polysphondylium violaceum TaxID=133409 RepID=A0A8J4PY72_9MYCE|nr:hypothetical protein CYY_002615 [Polysphondylium violaceum]